MVLKDNEKKLLKNLDISKTFIIFVVPKHKKECELILV